jgi:hypothetical protein
MGWNFEDVVVSAAAMPNVGPKRTISTRGMRRPLDGGRSVSASVRRSALTEGTDRDHRYGRRRLFEGIT